jgi:ribosomal protein S18 acetylase RimI-like enzyme
MTIILEAETTFTVELVVRLRLAREDDLPKLEWFGQYVHYRRIYLRTFAEQQVGQRLMLLADLDDFPIGQIFIHLSDSQRGLAQGRGRGYLYALRVMEPFQGKGIGTRLILAAEAILRERGYRWGVIAVAKENERARRLYERLGYTIYAEDAGRWHYTDHLGNVRYVDEPSWMLQKPL